jgi:hypothetical protein
VSLLEGLRIDDYVPGGLICGIDFRNTEYDLLALYDYFNQTILNEKYEHLTTREIRENTFFNVTGQLVHSIPDAVYNCYDLPYVLQVRWQERLNKFVDLKDF